MPLQPPLLVPTGDAENGERIIETVSGHLKRCARPSAAASFGGGATTAAAAAAADAPAATGGAADLLRNLSHGTRNSYQSHGSSHGNAASNGADGGPAIPVVAPNCCTVPCIDELILDLERLVTLRDEIVYSFDPDCNQDSDSAPDVVTLLKEYCALLGALLTVPGIGSLPDDTSSNNNGGEGQAKEVNVGGLFLTWNKLDETGAGRESAAMDIDGEMESHLSVSSFYAERQLSTYLLAVLEYQSAETNLSVTSSPASAARVLSDMPGTRDALQLAKLGFGRAAALFDHLRTVVENDRLLYESEGRGGGGGSIMPSSNSYVIASSDAQTRLSMLSTGSEYGESTVVKIPITPCQILDPSVLHVFYLASMAFGQTCFYYTALVQRKQMHALLAKLAAGSAAQYEAAALFARQMSEEENDDGRNTATSATTVTGNIRTYMPSKALIRETFAASEYYYLALAEYHEACVAHAKTLLGIEVARLSSSVHFIGKAEAELLGRHHNELLHGSNVVEGMLSEENIASILIATATSSVDAKFAVGFKSLLCAKVINLHTEVSKLMTEAEERWADDLPTDIPPTRPHKNMSMAPIPPEASFLDPNLGCAYLAANPPLQQLLDTSSVNACIAVHLKLVKMFLTANSSARNATNTANEELAKLGLPDSIATFKATIEAVKSARSNKKIQGIPPAMAEQIQSLHSSQGILLLKQNLYILQEVAALARQTLGETEEMMDETVQADEDFRQEHPTFSGRDVAIEHERISVSSLDGSNVVETNARQICAKIRTWLDQANDGDRKLCQVLEEIESDPKYQLIMIPLDQLEKLVRGGSRRFGEDEDMDEEDERTNSSSSAGTGGVDTLALEKQLEDLDALISSREDILHLMEKDILGFNQRERVVQTMTKVGNVVEGTQLCDALTDLSFPLVEHHIEKVNRSIQKQQKLLRLIVQLYSKFQLDRSAYDRDKRANQKGGTVDATSSPSKAYLQKIASALKRIEWIRPQLVQGRDFYQTILSNIEQLKKKVEDVNAVLASERIFFEDNHNSEMDEALRRRQEEEDERLARELMREAEEAAQNTPQTQMDPRLQEEDERLARELAQQFQEEANISSTRNTNISSTRNTDLVDNRGVAMGNANFGNSAVQLENVVDALGLADGRDWQNSRQSPMPPRRFSLGRLDENDTRPIPPPETATLSSASFGDIPREIFAPRGLSSGSDRFSMASLGGVSSIGSESIVRNFHRQLQQQQQVRLEEGADDDDENLGENLAGIPFQSSNQNEGDEEMAPALPVRSSDQNEGIEEMAPAPPRPLGGVRGSFYSNGGISRSGLQGRSSRPGVINVRNDELPELDVNDEAFAQLLAMDFPPDLVRDALSRYDSIERATEYILQNL